MLDVTVQRNLGKLLTIKRAKWCAVSASSAGSLAQDAGGETSPQEGVLQEAATAGTNTTTPGTAAALSTALGTASLRKRPVMNTASLGKRTLSNAVSGEDHRLRPLWEIKEEEVALPLEIAELFKRWKADPLSFLRSDSSRVPSSLKEHYDYTLSARTSTISTKILWRFITTAYYDIISALSQSDRYSITKDAVAFVVAAICRFNLYDRGAVESNIISWAKDGAKYRALATKVAGPCCYFFYPDISEWMSVYVPAMNSLSNRSSWIKYLPQNVYNKAAKLLLGFGIFEKA